MDRGQIVELHDRVFREALGQVGGQPRGLSGIARQPQRNGRYRFNISASRESERGLRLLLCQAHVAHQRLAHRSFGLVARRRFFFICALGRFGRAPRQFPCFGKLPAISGSVGFGIEHDVFESGLSHQRCRLTLHSCRIVLQEINAVKAKVILRIIQIVGLRLLRCRPGFIQAVNIQIADNEIRVRQSASGTEF